MEPATEFAGTAVPDVIRHPLSAWIPAFAGMMNFCTVDHRSNNSRRLG
jgi:hypothetical protein